MDTKDKMNERDSQKDQDRSQSGQQSDAAESNELSEDDLEDIAGGGCMTFIDSAGCSSHTH
jgi:hypothetical protein